MTTDTEKRAAILSADDPDAYRIRLTKLLANAQYLKVEYEKMGLPHKALEAWAAACRIERQLGSITTEEFLARR